PPSRAGCGIVHIRAGFPWSPPASRTSRIATSPDTPKSASPTPQSSTAAASNPPLRSLPLPPILAPFDAAHRKTSGSHLRIHTVPSPLLSAFASHPDRAAPRRGTAYSVPSSPKTPTRQLRSSQAGWTEQGPRTIPSHTAPPHNPPPAGTAPSN